MPATYDEYASGQKNGRRGRWGDFGYTDEDVFPPTLSRFQNLHFDAKAGIMLSSNSAS
jgi:hypothetical protein